MSDKTVSTEAFINEVATSHDDPRFKSILSASVKDSDARITVKTVTLKHYCIPSVKKIKVHFHVQLPHYYEKV